MEQSPTIQECESGEQVAPKPKKHSSVERVIVWTIIGILAAITFLEWSVKNEFISTYNALQSALSAAEDKGEDFKLGAAVKLIKGKPTSLEPIENDWRDVHAFRWRMIFKPYTIRLQVFEQDGTITAIDTESNLMAGIGTFDDPAYNDDLLDLDTPLNDGESAEAFTDVGDSPDGDTARPKDGESGNRNRRSYAEMDTNKDGSISKLELRPYTQSFFDTYDTNKDGKVSKEEFEAISANKDVKQDASPTQSSEQVAN